MYIQGLAQQTNSFLLCVGFGFLLDILYVAVRFIRKIFSGSKKAVPVQDILFFIIAALCTFLFLLYVNNGEMRGYVFLALFLGAVICHCTFGLIFLKLSDRLARFIRKTALFLLSPIRRLAQKTAYLFKNIQKNIAKTIKKDKNKENSSCNDGG